MIYQKSKIEAFYKKYIIPNRVINLMNSIKQRLFEFRQGLGIDQSEVAYIVDAHIRCSGEVSDYGATGTMSNMEIVESLDKKLENYKFYDNVSGLIESLNADIQENSSIEELRDLYYKIERQSNIVYRQPLVVLYEIICTEDPTARHYKIMNELSLYEWVPEIKNFMWKISTSPVDRANYSQNGGKAEDVYSIYTKIDEGKLVYVADHWFMFKENEVVSTTLEEHIKDDTTRKKLLLLEAAVNQANLQEDFISFQLDEDLTLKIATSNGKISINDNEVEAGVTLESLFTSNIVPFIYRNFYPVINEASQNLKSFVNVDSIKHVSNILNPYSEAFVFKNGDGLYVYRQDRRYGNTFHKYNNAMSLIEDINREFDYDLTFFFEDMVEKDVAELKRLEDREIKIKESITEVETALFNLATEAEMLKESMDARQLQAKLLKRKHILAEEALALRKKKNAMLSGK